MLETKKIHIIGAGLAGCEAALQLAKRGFQVLLYDMKPEKTSAAHHSKSLAEIVCSNSFGSLITEESASASGLLKAEMAILDCELLKVAQRVSVPAGKALAVDRQAFTQQVTEQIQANPHITFICENVADIPEDDWVLIATGPMTSPELTESIARILKREQLYFFDAAAPIISKDSIDFDIAFYQDRYDAGAEGKTEQSGSYINCPLDKEAYEALVDILIHGEKTELKSFEKESANFFESCMPVEIMASRGVQTLRYGPMKPVGLTDPKTGRWPYAVVQLRQDNAEGTLYNMVGFQTNLKWNVQKQMIQLIPGLQEANVVRYGVMHRNTYIHSPEVLQPTLQLKEHPQILLAGQLTGTEGYTESIATGMMAAFNIARLYQNAPAIVPPHETMLGALLRYITRPEAIHQNFQPINSNWGILPELPEGSFKRKDKKARNKLYVERSLSQLKAWMPSLELSPINVS
ncbi:methylenetetrahydrofolate--tRNA-(uracil(54)-C(5))-methyltransferase (FADH(2)-oxidizing) TrmFO [Vampirovibrio sp.]|uniref:methylenetetrahydrofolate--tRNA-(uracil(54)- C(5))-methyltransferase (FADH(2)-oxidizing) TrmFO n=1 Tax=Vampirovibrio sp. TaxID=2717857 RepID=UPI0035946762